MPISLPRARKLCTTRELDIVKKAAARALATATLKDLRKYVTLTRGLRDKYRTLAEARRRAVRGKDSPRRHHGGAAVADLAAKRELFAAVLGRFEDRLAEVTAADADAKATKAKAKAKAKSKSKKTAKRPAAKAKPKRKVARKKVAAKPAPAGKNDAAQADAGEEKRLPGPAVHVHEDPAGRAAIAAAEAFSRKTEAARNISRLQRANKPKIQGHVSARGRRRQASRNER